ncbi:hypothetical protein FSHL1_003747 [Fusarium sambucinum]
MFPTANKVVNVGQFQLFIQHIFHGWSSIEPIVGEVKLTIHNFGNYSVPVGTLKQYAPITEGVRGQGVTFLEDNRRAGQPVFCGITLSHEQEPVTFAFAWQDSQGRGISQRLIQFNRVMTVQQARYNVMAIYDENEIIRIGEYNTQIIVLSARPHIPVVNTEDMPRGLRKCILAMHYMKADAEINWNVSQWLEERFAQKGNIGIGP